MTLESVIFFDDYYSYSEKNRILYPWWIYRKQSHWVSFNYSFYRVCNVLCTALLQGQRRWRYMLKKETWRTAWLKMNELSILTNVQQNDLNFIKRVSNAAQSKSQAMLCPFIFTANVC